MSGTRRNYLSYHTPPSTCQTRSLKTIQAWGRHITNWNRCHPLPMWPPNQTSRWYRQTWTMMTSGISLPEIHNYWAKLPHLWPWILGNHVQPSMLVTPPQRHRNPHSGLYRPCKLMLLSGPQKNWSQGGQLPARKGAIQHLTGIQTWHYKPRWCLIAATWLQRAKPWQWGHLSVAWWIFLQAPHIHQSLRHGQHSQQHWPKSQKSTVPWTRNPQAIGPSLQSHLTRWHPLASWDHPGCRGRQRT